MLKSVKRLSLQPKRWSRRLRAFYWPETTLFLFIIGSLYIVNPDFFLFSLIRSCYYGVTGAVVGLFWESSIAKAIRGDIKFTSIIDLTALNIQEIFSLLVTMILVLFFVNNIVMEQWNNRTHREAQRQLVDLRLGRSKVPRISKDAFMRQSKAYTRKKVNQLLSSDEYREKFAVVRRAYDERKNTGNNNQNNHDGANAPITDQELFRPDFFDNQFHRIDRELNQARQNRQNQNGQRVNQNGPREQQVLQQSQQPPQAQPPQSQNQRSTRGGNNSQPR